MRKLELSWGTFLLVAPYWEAQTWFASLQALQVVDIRRLPFSDDLIIDLMTGVSGVPGVHPLRICCLSLRIRFSHI
jgi:hypothetical protein